MCIVDRLDLSTWKGNNHSSVQEHPPVAANWQHLPLAYACALHSCWRTTSLAHDCKSNKNNKAASFKTQGRWQVLSAKMTSFLLCVMWKCGDREWNPWMRSACFTMGYHNHSFSRKETASETKTSTTESLTLLLQTSWKTGYTIRK